jgi:macrolide transport system ATP-binding/permease protein
MRRFLARFANLFRRRGAEREMAREIESHLALLREDFERRGLAPEEATLAARRAYGGVEQSKELHRDARSFVWIEQLVKDVRYAWHNLLRNPGFTLVAVFAVALGIGVNATIFGIFNAAALKQLPVSDPSRVVRLKRWYQSPRGNQFYFTEAEYRYLREHSTAFAPLVASDIGDDGDGISALATAPAWGVRAKLAGGHAVSANYFAGLGVRPRLGRTFLPEEDRAPGANPVVVLDYRLWQLSFHGDPKVLGQTVKLNDVAYTIVGVAPEKFAGTDMSIVQSDFWVPLSLAPQLDALRSSRRGPAPPSPHLFLMARLKKGVSRERAQAETDVLIRRYATAHPEPIRTVAITLPGVSYFDYDTDLRPFQTFIAGVSVLVGLVLLCACANVTNMLLARGASRQREIAVRMALGAGRGRVVRQLLTESVMLACLAGAAAIPLSAWAGKVLYLALIGVLRGLHFNFIDVDVSPDARVLVYGLALSAIAGILFGLAPALRFTRLDLSAAMKDEGWVFGARLSRSRLRGLLLGAQVAVSVLLLMTSGVMMTVVRAAQTPDLGYETHNTYILMTGDTEGTEATGDETSPTAARRLRERLRALPEIGGVAIGGVPLGSDTFSAAMSVGKRSQPALISHETDGYFETMGIRLLRGRDFSPQEAARRAPVAVISEATARVFWPGEDPLGKSFSLHAVPNRFKDVTDFEVIGVARDVRDDQIAQADPSHVYLPNDGDPASYQGGLMFRIRGDREKALTAVQSAVEAVDRNLLPGLNLVNVEEGPVGMYRNLYRVLAVFSAALTLLALTLAAVGIYGVMAFLVSQRTREIGIRMALGATSPALIRKISIDGLRPVLIGMAIGFPAAAVLDMLIEKDGLRDSMFVDPTAYGLLAVVLAIAAAASVIPARRAMRVDPAEALRHE